MGEKDWPFDVPQNTGCITTKQVMEQGFPVLAILRDEYELKCKTDGVALGHPC